MSLCKESYKIDSIKRKNTECKQTHSRQNVDICVIIHVEQILSKGKIFNVSKPNLVRMMMSHIGV